MRIRSLTLAAATSLLLGVIGCDPSKAELDRTKQELQTVSAERDGLKSQLDQANGKVATLTQQVTDLQAKANAAPPPAAAEEKAAPAPAKTRKPVANKEHIPKAQRTPEQQKEAEQAEKKANTGASRF
jgi:hypothetical protein